MRRFALLVVVLASVCSSSCSPPAETAGPHAVAVPSPSPSVVNVYADASANNLRPDVAADKPLVYVPNTQSDDVYVIDPATYKVVDHFYGGAEPQHVVPAYDMRTL